MGDAFVSRKQRVLLVRHAQRADEAPGAPIHILNGYQNTRTEKPYKSIDPPLTEVGAEQARRAALHIAHALDGHASVDAVYTSPFARCVQTGHALALHMKVPLVVDPGVGACAMIVRKSRREGTRVSLDPPEHVLDGADDVHYRVVGTLESCMEDFDQAMERLARHYSMIPNSVLVVVTHREGIRHMDRRSGERERMSTPYCVVHEYQFDTVDGTWKLHYESDICKPEPSSMYSADQRGGKARDREFAFPGKSYPTVPLSTSSQQISNIASAQAVPH